jgi:hypothetical protein
MLMCPFGSWGIYAVLGLAKDDDGGAPADRRPGAARIGGIAIIDPAHATGARLVAVAARDPTAPRLRRSPRIERISYQRSSTIEVRPSTTLAQHGPGTAVASSPKPLPATPSRRHRARCRSAAGVPLEAFHYRYHPLMNRMLDLAGNGEIGDLVRVEARMLMPPPPAGDLRWDADVAGGGLMDVGCYAVHAIRDMSAFAGGEPTTVRGTAARSRASGSHAWLRADLAPSGCPPA